jgi:hypothetical protein
VRIHCKQDDPADALILRCRFLLGLFALYFPCPCCALIARPGADAAGGCVPLQVVLAMHDIADELVAKVKAGVDKLTVGRPEDNPDITPVISEASANFIQVRYVMLLLLCYLV